MSKTTTESQALFKLSTNFDNSFVKDGNGFLSKDGPEYITPASERILRSLEVDASDLDSASPADRLIHWASSASEDDLRAHDLALRIPISSVHHVPSGDGLYYDFKNTDRVISELCFSGASISGRVLDFGCSSGRNLAVLRRAYGDDLDLYGVDPAALSIDWAKNNIGGVNFSVSRQKPTLEFEDGFFDIVFAKSVWTHFSPVVGREWIEEMARILRPGGRLFFSAHGPHDVALRLVFGAPRPRYDHLGTAIEWRHESFWAAVVDGLARQGWFFERYRTTEFQQDLKGVENADTEDWGLAFYTRDFVQKELLSENLSLIRYTPAATAGRLDGYVARKASGESGSRAS